MVFVDGCVQFYYFLIGVFHCIFVVSKFEKPIGTLGFKKDNYPFDIDTFVVFGIQQISFQLQKDCGTQYF
jgi:hypothetical protein